MLPVHVLDDLFDVEDDIFFDFIYKHVLAYNKRRANNERNSAKYDPEGLLCGWDDDGQLLCCLGEEQES